jgi:hypothetical protein
MRCRLDAWQRLTVKQNSLRSSADAFRLRSRLILRRHRAPSAEAWRALAHPARTLNMIFQVADGQPHVLPANPLRAIALYCITGGCA